MHLRVLPAWLRAASDEASVSVKVAAVCEIDFPISGTKFFGRASQTIDGNLYEPYVEAFAPVIESVAAVEDSAGVTLANLDGVVRDLIIADEFYYAPFRLRLGIPGTLNVWTRFSGYCDSPSEVSGASVAVKVRGLMAAVDRTQIPRRTTWTGCPWVFGPVAAALGVPTKCGYAGPSATASGAGAASTTLTPSSIIRFHNAIGRKIKIGAGGVEVVIAVVGTTTLTLAEARTWSNADGIFFTDCRLTFADCEDAERTHEFGGVRGYAGLRVGLGPHRTRIEARFIAGMPTPLPHVIHLGRPVVRIRRGIHPAFEPIPFIFGKRLAQGIPVETALWQSTYAPTEDATEDDGAHDRRHNVAIFYLAAHGQLAGGPGQVWVGDKNFPITVREIPGGGGDEYLISGVHSRVGRWAVTGLETEAEYVADDWAAVRSEQNLDFRTATGTTYNGFAYSILSLNIDDPLLGPIGGARANDSVHDPRLKSRIDVPSLVARWPGMLVQAYDADGAEDGDPALSRNPVWCFITVLLDPHAGAGLAPDQIDWTVAKPEADYCDELILRVQSETRLVTSVTAGDRVINVDNSYGYKVDDAVYLGTAASSLHAVTNVLSMHRIRLGSAVGSGELPLAVGARVHVMCPRFELDLRYQDRQSPADLVAAFFSGCRGFITTIGGKVQPWIDRPRPFLLP